MNHGGKDQAFSQTSPSISLSLLIVKVYEITSKRKEWGIAMNQKSRVHINEFLNTVHECVVMPQVHVILWVHISILHQCMEILEQVIDIDLVINLKLREDVLLQKCLGRRICSQCGGNFNVASINVEEEEGRSAIYMDPLLPPPSCVSKLITRSDDTEEVVKERLRVYHDKSLPVEEFYRSRGKLLEFDLPGGIAASWPKLLAALNIEEDEYKERLVA